MQPSNIAETTLSANQDISSLRRAVWRGEDGSETGGAPSSSLDFTAPGIVTLQPRELRTFVVKFKAS